MDFAPHGATRKSNPNQTAFTQAGHEWWPRFPAPLARNSRFCGRFITPYAIVILNDSDKVPSSVSEAFNNYGIDCILWSECDKEENISLLSAF